MEEESSGSPKAQRPRAARGTGFPTLSLPESAKIIEKAGKYGRAHTAAGLATHMGLSTYNSGTFNSNASSLKEWGFITGTREGGFQLTEGAMIVAHPTTPQALKNELLAAFERSDEFRQTYETLAKNTNLEIAGVGNLAVNNLRVAIASKGKFARSFVESVIAVGLAEKIDNATFRLKSAATDGQSSSADDQAPAGNGTKTAIDDQASAPVTVAAGAQRATQPVLDQEWKTSTGAVRLQIFQSSALPAQVYTQLGKVAEEIERLIAVLDSDGEKNDGVPD